jgi:hypothetical protein
MYNTGKETLILGQAPRLLDLTHHQLFFYQNINLAGSNYIILNEDYTPLSKNDVFISKFSYPSIIL